MAKHIPAINPILVFPNYAETDMRANARNSWLSSFNYELVSLLIYSHHITLIPP
jgi:hypothetical protein